MSTPEGKRKSSVTLKDIALATGFSANTVSRALADKPDISLETKTIIREKSAQMGYIANALASFLRSGVSKVISIIVGDISNPHFSVMVKEMQTLLQKKGYTCVIFNTEEKQTMEHQAITTSISQNVDGIIICPTPGSQDNIRFLQSRHTPFVLIGRRFCELETSYVVCDDEHGGYIATRHLLENGHTNILFLNGPRGISSTYERLRGYQRALSDAGLPYRADLVYTVPITVDKNREKIEQALTDCAEYTAVLGFSDVVAWEAINILERQGKNVPKSCSVIGFDNIKFPYPVKLTTVTSSKMSMAKKAVDILMKTLSQQSAANDCVILETSLVDGDTVVPLAALPQ